MSLSDHPDSKIRKDAWKSVLFGKNLLKKNESNAMSDDTNALLPESNMVLGVYFSALWCPPCEQFLRDLIVFYSHIAESSGSFEIVYISSDKDEEQFTQYFSKMPWLALPFNAHDLKHKLTKKFCVDSIPTLVLIDSDGSVITRKGREKVYGDPQGLTFPWRQRSLLDELGNQFYLSATNESTADVIVPLKTIVTVNIEDLFKDDRYLALYFSAKWCAPCQPVTQVLKKYCQSLRERLDLAYDLQVIVCSMDPEEEEFQDHFLSMPDNWLAIPYDEKWRVEALSERFSVENIPRIVIIAPDSSILSLSARKKIESDLTGAAFPNSLSSPLIENLAVTTKSFGSDLNHKPALVLLMEFSTIEQQTAVLGKMEQFAEYFAKNKAATPDGPDMLFFINTSTSPIGEKIRTLMGLPPGFSVNGKDVLSPIWETLNGSSSFSDGKSHTPNGYSTTTPNESSETMEPTDAIDRAIKEYQSNGNGGMYLGKYDVNCGNGLCRTEIEDGEGRIEKGKIKVRGYEELKEEFKEEVECSGCITLSHENLNIPMHMIILDVPDGGVYYKYSSSPYHDPCYVQHNPTNAFMEEMQLESHYGRDSAISLFNIEQITRQFIKDYQMGNLKRRKLGGSSPSEI